MTAVTHVGDAQARSADPVKGKDPLILYRGRVSAGFGGS